MCRESREHPEAKGSIFSLETVAERDPEAVIASWCSRKAKRETIVAVSWAAVRAGVDDQLYEVENPLILQPGPEALTDGVDQLEPIVAAVARGENLSSSHLGDLRTA